MDTTRHGVPEALRVPDGSDNEKALRTRHFVIAQTTDPYCRGVAITVGKPVSVYSYD